MQKGIKTYKTVFFFILFSIFNITNIQAQEVGIKVDFFGFADNREFKAPFTTPKTIFGTRISPQASLTLIDDHKLITGVHYKQDFGKQRNTKNQANFIAYYNYETTNIDFSIGLIPREEKLRQIPRLVLADTFYYDRPNIEGMIFKYSNATFYQLAYIDWTNKQSKNEREEFIIGFSGRYLWNDFYINNNALLFHKALTTNNIEENNIQDNAVLKVSLGIDLSKFTFFDSLSFDLGFVGGFDRIRTVYTKESFGFVNNIHLDYKKLSLTNSLYIGQKLNLVNGDPFYKNGSYNRLDLKWSAFKLKNIEASLCASFHFVKNYFDNQQAFTLKYKFGKIIWREKPVH